MSLSQKQKINYNVKIINPKKKSIHTTKSLPQSDRFDTLSDLRRYVKEKLGQLQGTLGYIEPGHGAKGKMRELHDDEDVAEMYVLYKRKSDVLLWLYGSVDVEESDDATLTRKRPRTDMPLPTSTKRDSIAKTLSTVEDIVIKLKERHGESGLSVEQFNCWAHMINSGKCSSYEEPPNFPFFKKTKGKMVQEGDAPAENSCPTPLVTNSASPMKRLNMRTQCIEQLSKWHVLLESGAITQVQYEELKSSIIDDMKKM